MPGELTGVVYLVGAGPGDPELLTVKARRLVAEAEVLIYDHLVAPEILEEAAAGCELVFAGKQAGHPSCTQGEIDAVLIRHARAGRKVVRLKGGDPFVFGRGGEEAEALAAAGVPFEIVPGVTAALGAAAYAGIPLTHRAHSSSVVFLTGHEDPAKGRGAIPWEAYARLGATLCIYMGRRHLATIAQKLQAGGLSPETPAALVQSATTGNHRVLQATLGTLAERADAENFQSPSIAIVGEVAALGDKLAWFGLEAAGSAGLES